MFEELCHGNGQTSQYSAILLYKHALERNHMPTSLDFRFNFSRFKFGLRGGELLWSDCGVNQTEVYKNSFSHFNDLHNNQFNWQYCIILEILLQLAICYLQ